MRARIPLGLIPLVLLVACAVEAPVALHASGSPVPAGPAGQMVAAEDAIKKAASAKSLALLQRADVAAEVYYSETGTLEAFTPTIAQMREPGIVWNNSLSVVEDEVSIRDADPGTVLLVTFSGVGTPICAVVDAYNGVLTYGTTDTGTAGGCTGQIEGFEDLQTPPETPTLAPPPTYVPPAPGGYQPPPDYP